MGKDYCFYCIHNLSNPPNKKSWSEWSIRQTYVWLLTLRRCAVAWVKKIFAQRHGQTVWRGSKKKFSRNGATTQRKRLNPPAKTNIQRLSVAKPGFLNAHTEKLGTQWLYLSLTAHFEVDGKDMMRSVKTFDKVIEVEVTPLQKVSLFIKGNWQWLWATFFAPLGFWQWKSRAKNKKAGSKERRKGRLGLIRAVPTGIYQN